MLRNDAVNCPMFQADNTAGKNRKKVCYDREVSEPFLIKRKKEVKKSDRDGNRKKGKKREKKEEFRRKISKSELKEKKQSA